MQLRPATDDDLPFLLASFAGTRPLEVAALGGGTAADEFVAMQWEAKRRSARMLHRHVHEEIVVADGRAAGYVVWATDGRAELRLVDLVVGEALRNGGIGTAVVRDLLARADETGATVTLHVEPGNPAHRLYERLGFVNVADTDRLVRMERRPVS